MTATAPIVLCCPTCNQTVTVLWYSGTPTCTHRGTGHDTKRPANMVTGTVRP